MRDDKTTTIIVAALAAALLLLAADAVWLHVGQARASARLEAATQRIEALAKENLELRKLVESETMSGQFDRLKKDVEREGRTLMEKIRTLSRGAVKGAEAFSREIEK